MMKIDFLPNGWSYYPGEADTAPEGYRLATNGESRFSGYYETAWVPDLRQTAYWERNER